MDSEEENGKKILKRYELFLSKFVVQEFLPKVEIKFGEYLPKDKALRFLRKFWVEKRTFSVLNPESVTNSNNSIKVNQSIKFMLLN